MSKKRKKVMTMFDTEIQIMATEVGQWRAGKLMTASQVGNMFDVNHDTAKKVLGFGMATGRFQNVGEGVFKIADREELLTMNAMDEICARVLVNHVDRKLKAIRENEIQS